MNVRIRHLWVVILAQAVCVAVGLWMQHHLLRRSIGTAAQEEAWSEMEAGAEELLGELETLEVTGPTRDPRAIERSHDVWARKQPRRYQLTIVDQKWRTAVHCASPDQEQVSHLPARQSLSWTPSSSPARGVAKSRRGTLAMPDGPHVAVACALVDRGGYLLLHRPARDIEAGAAPYLRPLLPIGLVTLLWTVALLSMTAFLAVRRYGDTLDRERARSTSDTLRQTQTLIRTRDAVIFALAKLAGFRHHETGGHLERISDYATLLASALRYHPKHARQVTPAFVRLIGLSSVLHDIGKVGIEDSILLKPGKLTPAERQQMQRHTVMAGTCLQEIAQRMGNSNFLQMAAEIAVSHHEHWNGCGYPNGLKGEQIPLAARIVAIADTYDTLSTVRVYKDALPHEQCVAIIRQGAGEQFDPDLVQVWLTLEPKFGKIAGQYLRSVAEGHPSRFCPVDWETDRGADDGPTELPAKPESRDLQEIAESSAES